MSEGGSEKPKKPSPWSETERLASPENKGEVVKKEKGKSPWTDGYMDRVYKPEVREVLGARHASEKTLEDEQFSKFHAMLTKIGGKFSKTFTLDADGYVVESVEDISAGEEFPDILACCRGVDHKGYSTDALRDAGQRLKARYKDLVVNVTETLDRRSLEVHTELIKEKGAH